MLTPGDLQEEEAKLIEAFRAFDRSGSGMIEQETLLAIVAQADDVFTPEIQDVIHSVADDDGNVSYQGTL